MKEYIWYIIWAIRRRYYFLFFANYFEAERKEFEYLTFGVSDDPELIL